MTLIKDLINLPERVQRGDFVLRLAEGVTKADDTVDSYVVTKQLADCFDAAFALITSAVESNSSKAGYLHGSFGSGKSHFMAVLDLLLSGNARARSKPELAPVVARYADRINGRKFLLVPYHMIGADDMESAILGGYVEHLKQAHPDAPTPGVYRADKILEDAHRMRQRMGDEAFFASLNEGRGEGGGWGDIEAGWDATSFEAAAVALARSEEKSRLIGDLVERYFSSVAVVNQFVDLDTGLAVVSAHAKSLGYDALVLFLDEMILWLASRAADIAFVTREGPKLAKLVESQRADRPIPIVSFVARQRDLRDLVGEHATGADRLNFADVFKWWEDRFATIRLEDSNLPAIAEKRVLRPKDDAARRSMDAEFDRTTSTREDVMSVLRTGSYNQEMFRKVYPFSPALVEALVAVSFMLQRERTALKVMLQLLVDQRDRLKLGDIVPVGDLFDAVAEGDEAFNADVKSDWENAKRLFETKLRPLLESENRISFDDAATNPTDPRALALRNDDRLVKTLLLAALAPNVESLRGLTVNRLAALNFGTINTPIKGTEGALVLSKLRKWAGEVGQIKIGDDLPNPTISIHLSSVDTDAILSKVEGEDNPGNRIRKIKSILFRQLGIEQKDDFFQRHEFVWRSTKRSVEVRFTNIREMTDDELKAGEDDWKLVVDYPFDHDKQYGPGEDIARVEHFRNKYERGSRTIAWIPSFLSLKTLDELGRLVKLDFILKGERFREYVTHLSDVDKAAAKGLLDNQRSQLEQRMIAYLEGAYGIRTDLQSGVLDETSQLTGADHFKALDPGFDVRPAAGANLRVALEGLLDQAMRYSFPAHPEFDPQVSLSGASLRRAATLVERATQDPDNRVSVDRAQNNEMKRILEPLRVGLVVENNFVLGDHWRNHFVRKEAERGGGPTTVRDMRRWIDEPKPWGLPRELQDVIIVGFAQQANRSFARTGGPFDGGIGNLPDDVELRETKLPERAEWERAVVRANSLFGVGASDVLAASTVARLSATVKTKAAGFVDENRMLVKELENLAPAFGIVSPQRLVTARAGKVLLESIAKADEDRIVEVLAAAEIPTTEAALASSMAKAKDVVTALASTNWELLNGLESMDDERQAEAAAVLKKLSEAFANDELAVALTPALAEAVKRATRLALAVPKPMAPAPVAPTATPSALTPTGTSAAAPATPAGRRVVATGNKTGVGPDALDAVIEEIREKLKASRKVSISWEVYEP